MNSQQLNSTDEAKIFRLKPLSKQGVDSAMAKAEHYRLLNQPNLAESICLDILAVDQGNQKAQVVLLLALTDQFGGPVSKAAKQAMEIASKLNDEYSRIYYTGIVNERQGAAALASRTPGSDFDAFEYYMDAMECYDKAASIAPSGNDDPILRWNTCARIIMQHSLRERPLDESEISLE